MKIPFQEADAGAVKGGQLRQREIYAPDITATAKGLSAMGDAVVKIAEERDLAKMKEIDVQMMTAYDEELLGVKSKLGAESEGAGQIGATGMDARGKEILEQYKGSSKKVQQYAELARKNSVAQIAGVGARHEQSEVLKHSQQASNDQVAVHESRLVQDSLSAGSFDKGFTNNAEAFNNSIAEQARVNGMPVESFKTKAVTNAVTAYFANAKPDQQIEALTSDNVVGVMDEGTRQELLKQAYEGKSYADGSKAGADAFASGMGSVDAVNQAKKLYPEDETARQAYLGAYSQMRTARDSDQARTDMQTREIINTKLANGTPLSAVEESWLNKETGKTSQQSRDVTAEDFNYANTAQTKLAIELGTAKTDAERDILLNKYQSAISKNLHPSLQGSAFQNGIKIRESSEATGYTADFGKRRADVVSILNASGYGLSSNKEDKAKFDAQVDSITVNTGLMGESAYKNGALNPQTVLKNYGLTKDVTPENVEAVSQENTKFRIARNERAVQALESAGVNMLDTGYRQTPISVWMSKGADNDPKKLAIIKREAAEFFKVKGRQPSADELSYIMQRKNILK